MCTNRKHIKVVCSQIIKSTLNMQYVHTENNVVTRTLSCLYRFNYEFFKVSQFYGKIKLTFLLFIQSQHCFIWCGTNCKKISINVSRRALYYAKRIQFIGAHQNQTTLLIFYVLKTTSINVWGQNDQKTLSIFSIFMQNFAEGVEELDHFPLSSLGVKKGEKASVGL